MRMRVTCLRHSDYEMRMRNVVHIIQRSSPCHGFVSNEIRMRATCLRHSNYKIRMRDAGSLGAVVYFTRAFTIAVVLSASQGPQPGLEPGYVNTPSVVKSHDPNSAKIYRLTFVKHRLLLLANLNNGIQCSVEVGSETRPRFQEETVVSTQHDKEIDICSSYNV